MSNKSRRDFFQSMTALAVGPLAIAVAPRESKKYGCITVESHHAHLRATGESLHVYVNGADVTLGCYEADDVEGYAKVRCRDEEHHRAMDAKGALHMNSRGGVCAMLVRGSVVIKPGPAKL